MKCVMHSFLNKFRYIQIIFLFKNYIRFGRKTVFLGCCFVAGFGKTLQLFLPGHLVLFLVVTFFGTSVNLTLLYILTNIVAEITSPSKNSILSSFHFIQEIIIGLNFIILEDRSWIYGFQFGCGSVISKFFPSNNLSSIKSSQNTTP